MLCLHPERERALQVPREHTRSFILAQYLKAFSVVYPQENICGLHVTWNMFHREGQLYWDFC